MLNKEIPLVSIITPLFNAESFIGEAIESVQRQTYSNWEMIIVDNCSTDNSRDIVRKYIDKDKRIRLITSKYNSGGPARPRNIGIYNSNGKYISFLDADDYWLDCKLEKQVVFMGDNPDVFLLYSRFFVMKDKTIIKIIPKKKSLKSGNIFKSLFISNNYIGCLTVMLRNRGKDLNYYFDEDKRLLTVEDFDLWLRIAFRKNISYIDEPLCVYRLHKDSLSAVTKQGNLKLLEVIRKRRHQIDAGLLLIKYLKLSIDFCLLVVRKIYPFFGIKKHYGSIIDI
ncbi:MAG: glycosyltransferase [Candidatus Ancaeobacter aquaticus]|nr:glycosyltransferase [Candidatus Ancaeobacter aquaticus]